MSEATEHSLLFLVGGILAVIVITMTLYFPIKLYAMSKDNPDEATLGSLNLLTEEILGMKSGDSKLVPYYIEEGYFLRSNIKLCPSDRLCVCRDFYCEDIVESGVRNFNDYSLRFGVVNIKGTEDRNVKNVRIRRTENLISIEET